MAIKNIIARGIGFSPGSVKFIPTHGLIAGAEVIVEASLGNLGFGEQEDPRKRKVRKETLRREIEELFEDTREIKVPKVVEQQIVKIVAPGSDKIPSGVPIGDLLVSLEQMQELRDLLERLKEEDELILLMMA